MPLQADINQLTLVLLEEDENRMHQMAKLRSGVAEQLVNFRLNLQTRATVQQQQLNQQMETLCKEVERVRQQAAAFVAELEVANTSMAEEQRQTLAKERQHLVEETNVFRNQLEAEHLAMAKEQHQTLTKERLHLANETAAFRNQLEAQHQAMADEQCQTLVREHLRLANEIAAFRDQLDTQHQAMAISQRQKLTHDLQALQKQVKLLRQQTEVWLAEVESSRIALSTAQRRRMKSARASLMTKLRTKQAALRSDYDQARRKWTSFKQLKAWRRAGKPTTTPIPAPAP